MHVVHLIDQVQDRLDTLLHLQPASLVAWRQAQARGEEVDNEGRLRQLALRLEVRRRIGGAGVAQQRWREVLCGVLGRQRRQVVERHAGVDKEQAHKLAAARDAAVVVQRVGHG